MIYVDSSAAVKLVRREPGTVELVAWLAERQTAELVSSALIEVEVPRALRRYAPEALSRVPEVLARLYIIELDTTVRAIAAAYTDGSLRSLDAIHLASAQLACDGPAVLEAFVTYDVRLLASAAALGFPVASPGRG